MRDLGLKRPPLRELHGAGHDLSVTGAKTTSFAKLKAESIVPGFALIRPIWAPPTAGRAVQTD
jgi:hypothetical protein